MLESRLECLFHCYVSEKSSLEVEKELMELEVLVTNGRNYTVGVS